ncbi:MAG: ABC transporter ATP-binding protein, partial [Treponema sp.]|nr:ABC transporter ATP-binding protein [Treponema sp.]
MGDDKKTEKKHELKKASFKEFKTLLPYLSKYRLRYLLGLICLITVDAAQILIPQFIRRAVDLISSLSFEMKDILFLCLLMIAVMAVIAAGRFLWRYFIHGSSQRIETEMREKLFDHLLSLSWDFYQKNKI